MPLQFFEQKTIPDRVPTSEPNEDAVYLKALLALKGVGNQTIRQWIHKAGSPKGAWENALAFVSGKGKDSDTVAAFKQQYSQGMSRAWYSLYIQQGIQVLPYTHPDYPPWLREIHNAPLILYVKGNVEALSLPSLAVVGTRRASEYGKKVTQHLVQGAQGRKIAIVSGLAAGIDTVAHAAALQAHLPTVAVFGCGLDIISPRSNQKLADQILEQGGAWVSEYPLGMQPTPYTFPQRNRIVAGLCQGIVVTEGDVKSGALITARLALEEGRSIFAVPGNIFNPATQGPLHLIQSGAMAVSSFEAIEQELGWKHPASSRSGLSSKCESGSTAPLTLPVSTPVPEHLDAAQKQILSLMGVEPMSIENLQLRTGHASAKINELLTLLELEGLVELLPGAKVCRI